MAKATSAPAASPERPFDGAQDRNIEALLEYIESRQHMPHAWGRHRNDCVAFVIGAVEAQTGHSRATRMRWSSEASGLRLIKRLGGLEAALDSFLVRVPPAMAMRGDIAGVPDDKFGIHPMIVEGDLLVCPGEKGNRRAPRRMMVVAWSAVLKAPRRSK